MENIIFDSASYFQTPPKLNTDESRPLKWENIFVYSLIKYETFYNNVRLRLKCQNLLQPNVIIIIAVLTLRQLKA